MARTEEETMVKPSYHAHYTPPRTAQHTRVLYLTQLQENWCDVQEVLNALECHLCGECVGPARPLGIGMGHSAGDTQARGVRLCHGCFTRATQLHDAAQPPPCTHGSWALVEAVSGQWTCGVCAARTHVDDAQDAARYRWLVAQFQARDLHMDGTARWGLRSALLPAATSVDAAIDAAMQENT